MSTVFRGTRWIRFQSSVSPMCWNASFGFCLFERFGMHAEVLFKFSPLHAVVLGQCAIAMIFEDHELFPHVVLPVINCGDPAGRFSRSRMKTEVLGWCCRRPVEVESCLRLGSRLLVADDSEFDRGVGAQLIRMRYGHRLEHCYGRVSPRRQVADSSRGHWHSRRRCRWSRRRDGRRGDRCRLRRRLHRWCS